MSGNKMHWDTIIATVNRDRYADRNVRGEQITQAVLTDLRNRRDGWGHEEGQDALMDMYVRAFDMTYKAAQAMHELADAPEGVVVRLQHIYDGAVDQLGYMRGCMLERAGEWQLP